MVAPVIFLESASGHGSVVQADVAAQTANQLIKTLQLLRRANQKISLNSLVPLADCEVAPGATLQMLFAGGQHRDTWLFLKELKARTPYSKGLETWLNDAELTEAKTAMGQVSAALTWAYLLETGTVSFNGNPDWCMPWIEVVCSTLNAENELCCQTMNVRNTSAPEHVQEHQAWLSSLGFERLPSAKQFWADKESQFPGLRFLARVKSQIDDLATFGAPYKQALSSLQALSDDAIKWDGQGAPVFSLKVADGEHDHRRTLSKFEDERTGTNFYFDRHAYFTGSFPGRIHFRLSPDEKTFVVAYIGNKL